MLQDCTCINQSKSCLETIQRDQSFDLTRKNGIVFWSKHIKNSIRRLVLMREYQYTFKKLTYPRVHQYSLASF